MTIYLYTAPFTLLIVLLSILSIFIGIVRSTISPIHLPICIIEKNNITHLLKSSILKDDVAQYCHANLTCHNELCPLQQALCSTNRSQTIDCNDIHRVNIINGIPGLARSSWFNKLRSMHMKQGEISRDIAGKSIRCLLCCQFVCTTCVGDATLEVVSKARTSFFILGK
jgi:hypothetical protein